MKSFGYLLALGLLFAGSAHANDGGKRAVKVRERPVAKKVAVKAPVVKKVTAVQPSAAAIWDAILEQKRQADYKKQFTINYLAILDSDLKLFGLYRQAISLALDNGWTEETRDTIYRYQDKTSARAIEMRQYAATTLRDTELAALGLKVEALADEILLWTLSSQAFVRAYADKQFLDTADPEYVRFHEQTKKLCAAIDALDDEIGKL